MGDKEQFEALQARVDAGEKLTGVAFTQHKNIGNRLREVEERKAARASRNSGGGGGNSGRGNERSGSGGAGGRRLTGDEAKYAELQARVDAGEQLTGRFHTMYRNLGKRYGNQPGSSTGTGANDRPPADPKRDASPGETAATYTAQAEWYKSHGDPHRAWSLEKQAGDIQYDLDQAEQRAARGRSEQQRVEDLHRLTAAMADAETATARERARRGTRSDTPETPGEAYLRSLREGQTLEDPPTGGNTTSYVPRSTHAQRYFDDVAAQKAQKGKPSGHDGPG